MRKPVVDYRQFRFSKLNTPEFSHLKLLVGWIGYFALYFLTENLIPAERCTPVHIWLDDIIPFCEVFVIPYTSWFLLIVVSLLWFLLYDPKQFSNLQIYIIITQIAAMAVYILFPNRQDLRPTVFPRNNFLTDVVRFIYAFDTNTGVCPSLHAAYSFGIASAWLREKDAAPWTKAFIVILVIIICVAVTFVKQHSALDVIVAIPLGIFAEWFVYIRPKRKAAGTGGAV